MAAFDSAPMRTVSLEKVMDLSGDLPLGSVFNWTYKSSMLPSNALARARQALANTHPDEKPVNWKVVEVEPE